LDSKKSPLRSRIPWQSVGTYGGLVLLVVIASLMSPRFLTSVNIFNVLRQTSIIAIIGLGMTFVIITGGIDLSVGSVVALVSVLVAGTQGGGAVAALAAGLGAGALGGALNGIGVAWFRMPPFIVTLAAMTAFRGLAFMYSGGKPISGHDEVFRHIGSGYLGHVPYPVIYMFALFIAGYVLLRRTTIGVSTYAVGGNEEATRLSGVDVRKVKLFAYMLCGLCAAIAAIIQTSRLTVGEPIAGTGYELDAIAAVVIGGTSLSGGRGSVWGTLVGALILFILSNIFNILNVPSYSQDVFKGLIILGAVLIQKKQK